MLVAPAAFAGECVFVVRRVVSAHPFALLVLAAFGAPVPATTVMFVDLIGLCWRFLVPFRFWRTILVSGMFAIVALVLCLVLL